MSQEYRIQRILYGYQILKIITDALNESELIILVNSATLFNARGLLLKSRLSTKPDEIMTNLYFVMRGIIQSLAMRWILSGYIRDALSCMRWIQNNDRWLNDLLFSKPDDIGLPMSVSKAQEIFTNSPETYTCIDPNTGKKVRVKNRQMHSDARQKMLL